MTTKKLKRESVLDYPKSTLCPDVWKKGISSDGIHEEYQLTLDASIVIQSVINEITSGLNPDIVSQLFNGIHITGSITSNQYTDKTDIDLHFYSNEQKQKEQTDQLTKKFRSLQKTKFFKKHPIEIYVQPNKFQDFMSVGCYDYITQKWEVGPEFKSPQFDPYSEYYRNIQEQSKYLLVDVRNTILEIYEKAVVYYKVYNKTQTIFKNSLFIEIKQLIEKASDLMEHIRTTRSAYSQPKSKEEALKYRASKQWHIADATFKLLDKYGYLAILKTFCELNELLKTEIPELNIEIIESIILTVKKQIGNPEKLVDSEKIKKQVKEQEFKLYNELNSMQQKPKPDLTTIIKKLKVWLDARQAAPKGYTHIKDVNSMLDFIDTNLNDIDVVDTNFDAADQYKNGGNFNIAIDYLDYLNAKNIKIRIHTDDPVGLNSIRKIIKKNEGNGWKEITNVVDEEETVNEGFGKFLTTATLAGILSIPFVVPSKPLERELDKIPPAQLTVNSKAIKNAIEKVSIEHKKFGGMSYTNNVNMIAWTIWREACGEYPKYGRKALDAIACVILNRAAHDPQLFVRVISHPSQFSEWNNYRGGWTDSTYQIQLPNKVDPEKLNPEDKHIWNICKLIATEMLNETFKSTIDIGNRNMIGNPKKDNATAKATWGKDCDIILGNHTFGYKPEWDGYIRYKKHKASTTNTVNAAVPKIYSVKANDTLSGIAAKTKVPMKKIIQLNNIKDPNRLSIGQKLKLK